MSPLLLGAGRDVGAKFLPTDIPDIELWLAADKITGLADAADVVTWLDASGQGNDVTQITEANRPIWKVDILNGLAVVRFDGTDQTLDGTLDGVQPYVNFAVFKSNGGNEYVIDTDTTGNVGVMRSFDSDTVGLYSGGALDVDVAATTNYNIVMGLYDGASSRIIANGTVATGNPGATTRSNIQVSGWGGGGFFLNGDIAELGQISGIPSDGVINLLGNYLASRYALSWTDI